MQQGKKFVLTFHCSIKYTHLWFIRCARNEVILNDYNWFEMSLVIGLWVSWDTAALLLTWQRSCLASSTILRLQSLLIFALLFVRQILKLPCKSTCTNHLFYSVLSWPRLGFNFQAPSMGRKCLRRLVA